MPEAGEILQGKTVGGKFHLGRFLGGTDRSAVFLTERPQGQPKTAAIKLIPADPATAELQLSRWKQIAGLSHPHLLKIFESGRCQQDGEEVLYVVMEHAEENLAEILPKRSLTSDEADEMLKPALDALAYLHGRGLVHGHLKPANIMVVGEQLKLASDGICRIGELNGVETGTYGPPDMPGTAAAPARDVWSVGVTLVEVLTQLLPVWSGNEQQALMLPETLPQRFADIARNCLELDPQRRCTLTEIAEHLHYNLPVPSATAAPAAAATPAASVTTVASVSPAALVRKAKTVTARRPPVREQRPKQRSGYLVPAFVVLLIAMAIVVGVTLFSGRSSEPVNSASSVEKAKPADPVAAPAAAIEQPTPPISRVENKLPATAPRKTQPSARGTLKTASEVRDVPPPAVERVAPSAGGSIVPGAVIQQILPDVSRGASNTIHGTVRVTVKIRVDPAGNVAGVSFVSAGPSQYFAGRALDAAKRWTFSPARRDGQPVASAWTVRFEFIRGGVRVFPIPVL